MININEKKIMKIRKLSFYKVKNEICYIIQKTVFRHLYLRGFYRQFQPSQEVTQVSSFSFREIEKERGVGESLSRFQIEDLYVRAIQTRMLQFCTILGS